MLFIRSLIHAFNSAFGLSGSLMPQQPSFLICRNTFNSQFAIRSLIISFLAFSISSNCSLIQLQFVWNQKTAKTDWIEWEMKFKLELEWSQEKIAAGANGWKWAGNKLGKWNEMLNYSLLAYWFQVNFFNSAPFNFWLMNSRLISGNQFEWINEIKLRAEWN